MRGGSWPEGEILKVLDQSPPPYELPTTTDRFQTLANTGSGFAHAREITRENGEQRGVSEGENADIGGVALARPRSESAPVLAGIDEKNQPIAVGFWNFGGLGRNRTTDTRIFKPNQRSDLHAHTRKNRHLGAHLCT
jgi:hypothetical protein